MSILNDLNYIADSVAFPCASPDPLLLIRTGFEALPPALLEVLVPGCDEIMQARAGINPMSGPNIVKPAVDGVWSRPRRGGRHGKRVRGTIGQVGKPIPLGGRQFLYKTGFFGVQKALYFFQIVGVTTNFIARWQSLIYQAQNCQEPPLPSFSAPITPYIYPGGWLGVLSFGTNVDYRCGDVRNSYIEVAGNVGAAISWHVEWVPWPDPNAEPSSVTTYLRVQDQEQPYGYAETNSPTQKNGNRTGGFHRHRNPGGVTPTRYEIVVQVTGTTAMQAQLGFINVGCQGLASKIAWGCFDLKPAWPDWENLGKTAWS